MDEHTSVEEQLKAEVDALKQRLFFLQKENNGLIRKNAKQKRIMSQQREVISKLRSDPNKQRYYNVQKGVKRR